MPSKKPHVLLEEKYHSVLIKVRAKRTKEKKGDVTIPKMLVNIFETSRYFSQLKKELHNE